LNDIAAVHRQAHYTPQTATATKPSRLQMQCIMPDINFLKATRTTTAHAANGSRCLVPCLVAVTASYYSSQEMYDQ
jgi:hypothetical protein